MNHLDQVAKEYLAAVEVISEALRDFQRRGIIRPGMSTDAIAMAIIARLAKHEPPILLEMQECKSVNTK